jgi:hypothetical protein
MMTCQATLVIATFDVFGGYLLPPCRVIHGKKSREDGKRQLISGIVEKEINIKVICYEIRNIARFCKWTTLLHRMPPMMTCQATLVIATFDVFGGYLLPPWRLTSKLYAMK